MLVNGAEGIAVGMATRIPPHNLGEVIDGTLDTDNDGLTGQQLQALAQRRHPGLLAQRHLHRAAHRLERLRHTTLALQHLHHMQAKAAVHQARQYAHLDMAKQLAGKLGRAIAGLEPAQVATLLAAGAVGQLARGAGKGLIGDVGGTAVVAAHIQQAGLGTVAQGHHVHARRHRKQDVAQPHLLTRAVARRVGGMVALAGLIRRLGQAKFALQPGIDGQRRSLADDAVGGRQVRRIEQAVLHRRLAQQLGAGPLAQQLGGQDLGLRVQGHAVDASESGWGRGWRRAGAAGCGRPAG